MDFFNYRKNASRAIFVKIPCCRVMAAITTTVPPYRRKSGREPFARS